MSAQKPVYSRPSGDDPMPAPKRKRRRKRVHTTDTLHEPEALAEHDPLHENDGGGVSPPPPRAPTTGTHHTRNQRTHRREKRRARELCAENERLHRRLAAIYDALSID